MIAIKEMEMPKGCQRCKFFRKHFFGSGLDYSYNCMLGATEFPMPWIRQIEERASDCPLVEITTCDDCVSREELHKELYECFHDEDAPNNTTFVTLGSVRNFVKNFPPVTPVRKKDKWTNGDPVCPCCGEDKFKDLDADIWADWQPKFCPNCGAEMKQDQLLNYADQETLMSAT